MRFSHPRVTALGAVTVAGLIALTGCSSGSPTPADTSGSADPKASGDIVWADYGGPSNEARQSIFFDGFESDNPDATVTSAIIDEAKYMAQLRGEAGDYDIFQASVAESSTKTDNLHEVPEAAYGDVFDDAVKPYYIAGFVFGETQGWLTETFPDGGPENWADFFDTEKFPGKRAVPGVAGLVDGMYESALLADGVAPEDLYPLDIERAQKKLDTIKDDLVFYQNYPEIQQLLTSGSVSIAVSVTSQFVALKNAGQDVTIQWNEAFAVPSGFVAPKDTKNPEGVDALALYMADPERQAAFSEATGYGPANEAAFDYIDDATKENIVNSPSHTGILYWDNEWRGQNIDDMYASYGEWLNK